jgi:hypothetical protein
VARKNYVADFETTTDIDDCRVWAWGLMEIGNTDNVVIGNSIETFMETIENQSINIYFHNLRFDGEFIVNHLLANDWKYDSDGKTPRSFSTLISKSLQWYMIDIMYKWGGKTKKQKKHVKIYDSLKKIPFSVDVIGKAFNLDVKKIDKEQEFYERKREIGHEIDEEEKEYLIADLKVMAKALEIQFEQGLTSMTAGADSLRNFKDMIGKKRFERLFPILSIEQDSQIRYAYRGGYTYVKEEHAEKDIGEGIAYDVNSLYPSVMYNKYLPYGVPIEYVGEYEYDSEFPLFIQHLKCKFVLKKDKLPIIQLKKNMMFRQNEYLKSSGGEVVDLHVTNVDLELIKEHYHLYEVEYIDGFKFRQKQGIFKDFIDKWTYIKINSEGAIRTLAKLMLNSLYGKFATNPDVTGKIPYLKEDGSTGFEVGDAEERDPVYTPMGVFITSWARHVTITSAQQVYDRFIYCDTDSIHLIGTDEPETIDIHPKKLGYWKHEGTFKRAKFIRQKTYVEDYYAKVDENGKKVMCSPDEATTTIFEVKCAGMPDKVKQHVTYDNFKIGFTSKGKLLPKHVKGGIVLQDSYFTIK